MARGQSILAKGAAKFIKNLWPLLAHALGEWSHAKALRRKENGGVGAKRTAEFNRKRLDRERVKAGVGAHPADCMQAQRAESK
jgi:hypothetical protein